MNALASIALSDHDDSPSDNQYFGKEVQRSTPRPFSSNLFFVKVAPPISPLSTSSRLGFPTIKIPKVHPATQDLFRLESSRPLIQT